MLSFSVVIPNYNHSSFLKQRLDSILNQVFPDYEVIILDDCSTDNSRNIIETYRNHEKISHIIYNEKNSGSPFKQWIKGVSLAKGEYIWIAESDDIASPYFLEEAMMAFEQFPSAGIFNCDGIILDEDKLSSVKKFSVSKNVIFNTQKWDSSYFQKGITELNECLKFDNTINNASGVLFRKKLFNIVAPELDNFRYYGDWYFYIRLCLAADICYSAKVLNTYRKHKKSLLNSPISVLTSRKEYFRILQLLYNNPDVTDKKKLLDHFSYHFLSPGLFTYSPVNSLKIIKAYFQIDKKLAVKVIPRLILSKLFRRIYRKYKVYDIDYKESNRKDKKRRNK